MVPIFTGLRIYFQISNLEQIQHKNQSHQLLPLKVVRKDCRNFKRIDENGQKEFAVFGPYLTQKQTTFSK